MIQIILFMLISFNSWSDDCNKSMTMEGVQHCLKELDRSLGSFGKSPRTCAPLATVKTTTKETKSVFAKLAEPFSHDGAVCTNFISTKGTSGVYGPWGKSVVDYLKEQGPNSVFMSSNLAGMSSGVTACPNWKNMSADEKQHFWVWVMAAISKVESTCKPQSRNGAGTNGVAVGLVQLDERHSARNWRGDNCKVKSVNAPEANLRCGLDIMGELLKGQKGDYKGSGELWGRKSNSYWQHLRQGDGGEISDLIKLNPYCKK